MAKSDPASADGRTEITLGLLSAVEENSAVTQRSVASELGIALGLTNAYLKRCIKKGLIKVNQIPPNRYAYYLTPKGFTEKSRLTAEYLSSSFTFFRRARSQCAGVLSACEAKGWRRIALWGEGDLAEIASLCAREFAVELVGVVGDPSGGGRAHGLRVVGDLAALEPVDAVMVTDLADPQGVVDQLEATMPQERVLTPAMLRVARRTSDSSRGDPSPDNPAADVRSQDTAP